MKKNFLGFAAMAAMMALAVTSCGDSDSDGSGNGEEQRKDTPALTEKEQKAKLESVAKTLINKFNANDYKNFQYISDQMNDSKTSVIDDWFDTAYSACQSPTTKASESTTLYYLIKLSNYASEFTLGSDKKWTQDKTAKEVDYLQFTLKDTQGQTCVLKVEKSGKETPMHIEQFDTEKEQWYYNYTDYSSYYTSTIKKNTYCLPEHIKMTLTQAGNVISSVNINLTAEIKDTENGEFNYTTDKLSTDITIKAGDIDVVVDKCTYNGGTPATSDTYIKLSKNGETLLEANVNAKGTFNSSAPEKSEVKSATTVVKVLSGEVIIESNASGDFIAAMNDAEDNKYSESAVKSAVSKMNSVIDANVYFSNSKNSSAKLRFDALSKKVTYYDWSSGSGTTTYKDKWYYEPVITFNDGSSYSTLQSYFDKDTYDNVISKFEDLVDSFKNMFKKK